MSTERIAQGFGNIILKTTISKIVLSAVAVLVLFGNVAFFKNVLVVYPVDSGNILFLISLAVVISALTAFIFSLFCYRSTVKPILITVFLLSSSAAYYMDTYNVIFDDVMIENIAGTNTEETMDLLSVELALYLLFLGILPSVILYKTEIVSESCKASLISRLKLSAGSLAVLLVTISLFSDFYASFFREHKPLRYYTNPTYYIYSVAKYAADFFETDALPFRIIAADAEISSSDTDRELVVFVVGEAARLDHLSLNGYGKKTNPELEKIDVISFTNFWSCGTSTAVSVPCMFSYYRRDEYDKAEATATENILDILQYSGVNILWLDNNSDSKGVADRVPYESYRSADKNPVCDVECRDVGMLSDLQSYIDNHPRGDIFIVLHQMGNHGPAYYKRYPEEFEKFVPVCKSNELASCSDNEINNAYDNAILYTDYFLSRVIALLEKNDNDFESAMLYVSDHGESLGERNLFLHGLPYMIAPDTQKRVPVIVWFGERIRSEVNIDSLRKNADKRFSHDNIFHTILGIMEVQTTVYEPSMDLIEHEGK